MATKVAPPPPAAPALYHPVANPAADPDKHGPVRVIYGGLMRMGSFSMAHAFARLGLRTHHLLERPWSEWVLLSQAAHATFPLPNEHPQPFTRAHWDELFGGYDAVTDAAGFFVPQLVAAYPDAKVVLVQRDFDAWWRSFHHEVAAPNFPTSRAARLFITLLFGDLLGVQAGVAMKRMLCGWFRATDLRGVERNARARYDEHYAWIRANVPAEQLLEYRLGDGWEPLCAFLGADVPDGPFPRVNDAVQHQAYVSARMWWLLPILARRIARVLGVVCILVGSWAALRGEGLAGGPVGWLVALLGCCVVVLARQR